MVRIAPVRLTYNPKTLWFDARDYDITPGDAVIVLTARGLEFGHLDEPVFEATHDQISSLNSALKPVHRLATDDDIARAEELDAKSREALPIFRQLAEEKAPDMNPVAVEFLFDGDKAVFYFESEDRIDFRDLVRDLAARFHIRIDMKQIGVRDEARMVGGIGHCGQELCCRRLGGEFNPVSIRMAKEQGLSLNPQKISGLCGRLMCCLRYEFDAYKDFHSRAPKKNAKVTTPEGEGKVVDFDVPREIISILVEDQKPVGVPLAEMDTIGDSPRPNAVGEDAWERAHSVKEDNALGAASLLTSQLTERDALANPHEVCRFSPDKPEKKQPAQNNTGHSRKAQQESEPAPILHKQRRRRSTKVGADGTTSTVESLPVEIQAVDNSAKQANNHSEKQGQHPGRRHHLAAEKHQDQASAKQDNQKQGSAKQGASHQSGAKQNTAKQAARQADSKQAETRASGEAASSNANRNRRRRGGSAPKDTQNNSETRTQRETQNSASGSAAPSSAVKPGRKSSALRSHDSSSQGQQQSAKNSGQKNARSQTSGGEDNAGKSGSSQSNRRPRRRHNASGNNNQGQTKQTDQN